MPTPTDLVIFAAIAFLMVVVVNQGRRLNRLRRRIRRSLWIGPESHLRLQKQLFSRIAAEDCRVGGITPALPLEFRSEYGEDTLLYDLFSGQFNGVYVEAGALDGRTSSVTWIFEALGWTGLLVEPIPERAAECRAVRPNSIVVHAALDASATTGTAEFLVPSDRDWQPSAHRAGSANDAVMQGLEKAGASLHPVQVPLTTLDAALDRAGFARVDFAVIDVEGMEPDVLRGLDLDRFRPRVLVVEDLAFGRTDKLGPILEPAGYAQLMWIGANRVFVRTDDHELSERAARLAETVYSPFVRPTGNADTAARDLG